MKRYKSSALLLIGLVSVFAAGTPRSMAGVASEMSTEPAGRWRGPNETLLPFTEDREVLEFLRSARVIATKQLSMGKNRPLKVKLEKDGIEANAIFRTVNVKRSHVKMNGKTYHKFYDRNINECAAYELSRLLDLDNVPPCVPRTHNGKEGTLQLWVENAKTLKHMMDEDSTETTTRSWIRQRQTMRVFDGLIYNFDRNQGNMLFDSAGKLWFIDHTRSFLPSAEIEELDKIVWCERNLWEKLQDLDKGIVYEHLNSYLDYQQTTSLLKRKDKLVDHLEGLINTRGENAVLFEEMVVSNTKIVTSEMQSERSHPPSYVFGEPFGPEKSVRCRFGSFLSSPPKKGYAGHATLSPFRETGGSRG